VLTEISPFLKSLSSETSLMIRTGPAPIFEPTARPVVNIFECFYFHFILFYCV
jgi:hypothetical protein